MDNDPRETERRQPTSDRVEGGGAIVLIGALTGGAIIAVSWVRNMFHVMGAQPSAMEQAAFNRSVLWGVGIFGLSVLLAVTASSANRS